MKHQGASNVESIRDPENDPGDERIFFTLGLTTASQCFPLHVK